jgi:precorrin-6A/cobalt-precorrin-6A reductase
MAHGLPLRLLILGGTAEASALARLIKGLDWIAPTLSLAGRTSSPVLPPIPARIGGFGGVDGLADYLRREAIDLLIDATHPFANRISANATEAAAIAGVPRLVLQRGPWIRRAGDDWREVGSGRDAAEAIGAVPAHVFLTIGRQDLLPFRERAPQHDYLIRSVDAPGAALLPPKARVITARGPFDEDRERALMERNAIDVLVTKNSGGTDSKLRAARSLGLPVILIARPMAPTGETVETPDAALAWVVRHAGITAEARGV